MIINIDKPGQTNPVHYPFQSETKVLIGRNPKAPQSERIVVEEPNASRTHLAVELKNKKVMIMDLGSSNGTFVNSCPIQSNEWIEIDDDDSITLGFAESLLVMTVTKNGVLTSSSRKEGSRQSSSRSRQKKRRVAAIEQLCRELKISESSLKMLKQMASEKRSRDEKIKFLKLMGCKNVEENWEQIEVCLKDQTKYHNSMKKSMEELSRQFEAGKTGNLRKGLGKI